ncbi:hypothetical protein C1631_012645 [Chryseobacterium phosphatilyticum]|uniref:Uncharacterized protein n=1 Tax=Chryseobacterium phosphatilyticum TaxID=475075 RepID=A0A316X5J3_9FLAO|nr:hypothetical protein [Chryseobacterium phosphatilyticum]PWN68917.1 hypothetical protein C1631_012645 [Chryseobacterium phosphatilyticum]
MKKNVKFRRLTRKEQLTIVAGEAVILEEGGGTNTGMSGGAIVEYCDHPITYPDGSVRCPEGNEQG